MKYFILKKNLLIKKAIIKIKIFYKRIEKSFNNKKQF